MGNQNQFLQTKDFIKIGDFLIDERIIESVNISTNHLSNDSFELGWFVLIKTKDKELPLLILDNEFSSEGEYLAKRAYRLITFKIAIIRYKRLINEYC